MKKLLITIGVAIFGFGMAYAEKSTWKVPEDQAGKLAPVEFNDAMRKSGQQLFDANCLSCHSNPTKGNFQPLVPPPGDPAAEKFSMDLDGELLYKIREGKGLMPSFKNTLSISQTWDIIAYFRSFHTNYTQEVAKEVIKSGLSGGKVAIRIKHNKEKHRIEALVTEVKPEEEKPITGAAVKVFAQRQFGELQLGEEKQTDNDGKVWFADPEDLPGDVKGNVSLVMALSDVDAFGEAKEYAVLNVGVPTHKPSLRENRAMWNTVQKAPIWILLTYILGVLGIWGVLFLIVFQIRKIFLLGKAAETEQKA